MMLRAHFAQRLGRGGNVVADGHHMGVDLPVEPVHEAPLPHSSDGPSARRAAFGGDGDAAARIHGARPAGQLVKAHPGPLRCARQAQGESEGVQVAATMVEHAATNRPASPPGRASAPGPGGSMAS